MLNDNRAEANQLRLAFKKIAKEKQLIYCLKFNAKGVPCADGKCRYYPCCEWSQLYEIEVAAGGLKGSFYEGTPDSMKPKAKEKTVPRTDDDDARLAATTGSADRGTARRAHSVHRTPSCARRRGQHRPCWPRSDRVSALERGRAAGFVCTTRGT